LAASCGPMTPDNKVRPEDTSQLHIPNFCSSKNVQCVLVIRESFTKEYGSRVFHSSPCGPRLLHIEPNQLSLITRTHCIRIPARRMNMDTDSPESQGYAPWIPTQPGLGDTHTWTSESLSHCQPILRGWIRAEYEGVNARTYSGERNGNVTNGVPFPEYGQIKWFSVSRRTCSREGYPSDTCVTFQILAKAI